MIWPRALERRAEARLRIARAGYDPIVIRAVDSAGLLNIHARQHMRCANVALAWIRMAHIRNKYAAIYGTVEDKGLLGSYT
jgi:hypothetical protein